MGKAKRFIDKIWYGTGAIGLDLSYGMFYSFLNKYLTDVLKLKANFLLILTPIARIWDGINDPMMGTIVDNTHTRMGKYRPWILRGALMNAVVLALLFNNPGIPTNGPWIYVYIAVLYIGWGMTNTLADIPYWSMVPSFTTDPKERSLIATIARTFSGLGQGIITIGAPLLMQVISTTVSPDGGKAFLCLPSTYTDRKGHRHSNILPHFHGEIVTSPRSQVFFIVTEYGAVNLEGRSTWERAEMLVSVAHPDYRDELIEAAEKMKIWRKSNKR